ncbi:MAG: hypothetical protein WBL39_20940, partial [Terrimicrobiaceae bacterium]
MYKRPSVLKFILQSGSDLPIAFGALFQGRGLAKALLESRFGTSDLFGVCDGLGGQLGVPR